MEPLHHVDRKTFHLEAPWFVFTARRWRDVFVVLDTEFPGTPYRSKKPNHLLSPAERYAVLKQNVDTIHPIQVGITLCHRVTKVSATWQFDLCDFDSHVHLQVPDSIALLKSSGIDLERTRLLGVPSTWIVQLLLDAGLLGCCSTATWVTFHGNYDFAILLKAYFHLTRPPWIWNNVAELPCTLTGFLKLTRYLFGSSIYDVKCLMKQCSGLSGGLESVAAQLGVGRMTGLAHQAGSDSLLTCDVFLKMGKVYFSGFMDKGGTEGLPCQGKFVGFEEE